MANNTEQLPMNKIGEIVADHDKAMRTDMASEITGGTRSKAITDVITVKAIADLIEAEAIRREQALLGSLPEGLYSAHRYNTDNEMKIHLWDTNGTSYDIAVKRQAERGK